MFAYCGLSRKCKTLLSFPSIMSKSNVKCYQSSNWWWQLLVCWLVCKLFSKCCNFVGCTTVIVTPSRYIVGQIKKKTGNFKQAKQLTGLEVLEVYCFFLSLNGLHIIITYIASKANVLMMACLIGVERAKSLFPPNPKLKTSVSSSYGLCLFSWLKIWILIGCGMSLLVFGCLWWWRRL